MVFVGTRTLATNAPTGLLQCKVIPLGITGYLCVCVCVSLCVCGSACSVLLSRMVVGVVATLGWVFHRRPGDQGCGTGL